MCQRCLHEEVDVVVKETASGTRSRRSAERTGTASWSCLTNRSAVTGVGAIRRATDDSRNLSRRGLDCGKVLIDVCHRDEVEWDIRQLTESESVDIPKLDVALLSVRQRHEGCRSCAVVG